jgi:hypothetical protein
MQIQPRYNASRALIIGIDAYAQAPPLMHAASDARAVGEALITSFSFPPENVTYLLDEDATKRTILSAFMSYSNILDGDNDRIIVFFAGHGHTATARRGEVGFLIPHDGTAQDLSTLIRWEELTRGSDLIPAKHILFIMDACYGGLAITRSMRPGAMRFLNDMLMRYARQVITAGKADEVVADVGGPIPGHSVFTGHLLEGLSGKAADSEGLITANGIMAYVYHHVGHDPDLQQTPHFGYLDGDGDLILAHPVPAPPSLDERAPDDILVFSPSVSQAVGESTNMTLPSQVKHYISEPRFRIELHDLVAEKTRAASALTARPEFAVEGGWNVEEFAKRLQICEQGFHDLVHIQALVARWGTQDHLDILTLPSRRLAGPLTPVSGLQVWIALRWYPVLLLAYSSGLGSIAGGNLAALSAYMHAPIAGTSASIPSSPLIVALNDGIGHAREAFKQLPGHDRQFVPMSEYLYKYFQPILDDLLFLGTDYDSVFDRYEILAALEYAHLESKRNPDHFWGPIGRFGWKHRRGAGPSPFRAILEEAEALRDRWPPIAGGLFDSSYERFHDIASKYAQLIGRMALY